MKICLSTTMQFLNDLEIEDAAEYVTMVPILEEGGLFEGLTAQVEHLTEVIQTILTPEQIITLLKKRGHPDAVICDLDEDECKPD